MFCLLSLIGDVALRICYIIVKNYIYKVHALIKEKRAQYCLLIFWIFPSHEKSIYYIWKPGLFSANSSSGEYEHILCTHIIRSSVYKLSANKSIYLKLFLFDLY